MSNSSSVGGWGFNKCHQGPRHELRQSPHFGPSFPEKSGLLFALSEMPREKADAQFAGSAVNLPLPLAAVGSLSHSRAVPVPLKRLMK